MVFALLGGALFLGPLPPVQNPEHACQVAAAHIGVPGQGTVLQVGTVPARGQVALCRLA